MSSETVSASDEQAIVDTLPEGLPISDDLLIDVVSELRGELDLSELPTGEGPSASADSLPTRKAFDEEPTRKKHAPKVPREELTDVSAVHELFKDWNNN